MKNDLKFNLPIVYPESSILVCEIASKEPGETQIKCQVDRDMDKSGIMIERTIIKDELEEVLILKGIGIDEITCSNGLLKEANKRTEINISFRQVSHFAKNENNGFSFFFAALVTQKLTIGFSIDIKVVILVKDVKKEKVGKCSLQSDVSPNDEEQVQGDFKCEVILEKSEYENINFTDSESVKISPDNDVIGGISDLDKQEASPIATDIAIKETQEAQEKGDDSLTELAECLDYSLEENKKRIPPSFDIVELINVHDCQKKGKIRIRGRFSSEIKKEMHFFLPLSFPASQIKCKVYQAPAGEEVETICKIQKEFKLANSFVLEKRMIKNRHKEMVFIKSKRFNFNTPFNCENYNNIRLELANIRQKADFSFLQLSKFKPVGKKAEFFMGLTRKNKAPMTHKHFEVRVRHRLRLNNLRQLAESLAMTDLSVTCDVMSEFNTALGLNCLTDKDASGTPVGIEINTDEIDDIAGFPDDADPSKLNYVVDYSDPENLKLIDSLPVVEIESVDGSDCEEKGTYIIEGKVKEGELKDFSNAEVPFGSPDSTGLCDIKVNGKEVTMNCHNKEKFDISSIIFEPSVIKDSQSKEIFKLENYYNQKRFACAMSVYSEIPKKNTTDESESTSFQNIPIKKSSSGLSGGAIAAIVICLTVILAIIAIIVSLIRSGKIGKSQEIENTNLNGSDMHQFAANY